jgi:AcrR family transcriptional regulator
MPPRAYNNANRQQQQQELRSRIAAAAARLHASKGAMATRYADIAKEAGVSLPTVYNHFPDQETLIGACTGHVVEQAPEMPAMQILAAPDLREAAELLVEAMDRSHLHFEPWLVWGESRLIPALAELRARNREELAAFIAQVLRAHLPQADVREAAATWESLLSFELWHRLAR